MAEPVTFKSPLWWLVTLDAQLRGRRRTQMALMDAYYRGEHPLPFLTKAHESKMRDEFTRLLADSRSNFMRLIVDACEERLAVEGFRLSASTDEVADEQSWAIWQANQMDAESQTAFLEALVKGVSYLSVWAGDPHPTIAVEDPMQTVVGYVAGSNFREREAALKVWIDEWTGELRANVYLPDGIYKFAASKKSEQASAADTKYATVDTLAEAAAKWSEMTAERVANPLGIVPIVPLRNRPRLLCEGESEIWDSHRIQNQVNGFMFLLALAGYFGAHRQRWAVGLKIHEDRHGKPIEPYDVAIDRILQSEDPNVKFGEFGQTDLGGYIDAIEQKITHLAVTTRTPRHYLVQEGQSPSGDALESAESGLVKKVERKQRPFGEGLEEAMRLARLFAGESDSPPDSEIVWADAKTRTEATVTDAVIKQYQAKLIPKSEALNQLGYSQTAVARILAAAADEFAADPAPPPPPDPEPDPES